MDPLVPSVLVIDDESTVREMITGFLKVNGVQKVVTVPSAEEALARIETEKFTIIICDYRLEGMNGVAFMKLLRSRKDLTPILFISGIPDTSEVQRAAQLLKAGFLQKPFTHSELVNHIRTLLS